MPVLSVLEDIRAWLKQELNFFRVHLLFFLITPLVSAAVFWGVNGKYPVAFIDALFLCYSALTVTGLSTVNLSTCTVLQQVILFVLMCIGNVTVVAWVMVLIRKSYFRTHLENLQRKEHSRRKIADRISRFIRRSRRSRGLKIRVNGPDGEPGATERIFVQEGIGAALVGGGSMEIGMGIGLSTSESRSSEKNRVNGHGVGIGNRHEQSTEKEESNTDSLTLAVEQLSPKLTGMPAAILKSPLLISDPPRASFHSSERGDAMGRVLEDQHFTSDSPKSADLALPSSPVYSPRSEATRRTQFTIQHPYSLTSASVRRRGVPVPQRRLTVYQPSQLSDGQYPPQLGQRGKDQGQGGLPGPIQITRKIFQHFQKLVQKFLPKLHERLKVGLITHNKPDKASLQWLTEEFGNLIIGRNSDFNTEELTDEELEELGGLEYRALRLLSYLVAFYFVGTQLIAFLLIAPWLSTTHQYDDVFAAQPRLVNKSWFVAFQIVGSYTGGGMSLVDQGMVPFQKAYLMIFGMIFAILAGNHGLPIFLRLTIWILTKLVDRGSTADRTLHFLLDHPRRCFLYLFPSHVTWFLVATLLTFTSIEWVAYIVLDIGLNVVQSLPPGIRALTGLFQSFAVRASGFTIVSLSSLAPSFQFLCIILMYIAVYPVAMSIRTTNVYEEQSLGVFEAEPEDQDEEPTLRESQGSRGERISKYFGWHLRRQVAYDIWWLVWGIFFVCVMERTKIMDDENAPWFNLFRIVFELVSAFGGIGLTLGIPTQNYSFSGALGPLSKLVVIIIMLRGRHRGLPVAVDRAILLPEDMVKNPNQSQYDPRSPTSQSPTTVPISKYSSPEKGRSPLVSPKMDHRVHSKEGPQPNIMDLVHMRSLPTSPPPISDARTLNVGRDFQGMPDTLVPFRGSQV